MTRRILATVALLGAVALGAVSCKQGRGDRCQIDSDCGDGLTCMGADPIITRASGQCEPIGTNLPDSAVDGTRQIDAPPLPDGPDAAADGPADADG